MSSPRSCWVAVLDVGLSGATRPPRKPECSPPSSAEMWSSTRRAPADDLADVAEGHPSSATACSRVPRGVPRERAGRHCSWAPPEASCPATSRAPPSEPVSEWGTGAAIVIVLRPPLSVRLLATLLTATPAATSSRLVIVGVVGSYPTLLMSRAASAGPAAHAVPVPAPAPRP